MTKTRQWAIFTLVAVLVVLAGGWELLVSPQRSKASDLKSQASSAQNQADTLRTQLAQLVSEKRGLAEQQKILAEIATKIPNNPAEPTLIQQLQAAAHTAGVDMSTVNVSPPTVVTPPSSSTGTTNPTTGTTTAGTAPTGSTGSTGAPAPASTLSLYQVPVQVVVTGSYFNVEMFEHELETLPRAMLVSNLAIAKPNAASGSGQATPGVTGVSGVSGSSGSGQTLNPNDVTATISASVFLSPPQTTPTTPAVPSGSTTTTTSS